MIFSVGLSEEDPAELSESKGTYSEETEEVSLFKLHTVQTVFAQ